MLMLKDNKVTGIEVAGLAIIEQLAAKGLSDATIGKALGTTSSVLRRLIRDDEKVQMAYEVGKGRLADELQDILLTHAREGNVTAAIFLSKARLNWRDTGPAAAPQGPAAVNIFLPQPMSDESFRKMITVKSVEVPSDKSH